MWSHFPIALAILSLLASGILGFLAWFYRRAMRELAQTQSEYREQREAIVDMLNRIGLRINASLDLDGALEIIAEYLIEATQAESGAIFLLDAEGRSLRARAIAGMFPPMHETTSYVLTKRKYLDERIRRDRIQIGEGVIGFVAKTGESLLIADAMADPRVPKTSTDFLRIESMLVAPLRSRQKILGVFALVNRRGQGAFTNADLRLLQQLAQQAALTVDMVRLYEHDREQRRIEQELRVAQDFQRMLLPSKFPQPDGFNIAAFSKPALEVGGDYFDFIWVEEPRLLGVAIVDVSGKGIPGALVMASLRSALRAAAPGCREPKEVLKRVNRQILEDTRDSVFVTMTYAILDVEERTVRFCRAGHEPLILCNESGAKPQAFQPNGIALGLVGDAIFNVLEECETRLEDGDTMVLYTDGVVEALNAKSEEYGSDRFRNCLLLNRCAAPAEQIDGVLGDIDLFAEGVAQSDDITLVAIKAYARESQAEAHTA